MSDEIKPVQVTPLGNLSVTHLEGALEAPIIFFDEVVAAGTGLGVGRMVLCALVQDVGPDGTVTMRRKAVAQLRGGLDAFSGIRSAVNQIELMASPPTGKAN